VRKFYSALAPCYLFSLSCQTDADCEETLPGTECRTHGSDGAPLSRPYCWAPAKARDDYASANAGAAKVVPVLDNDTRSEATCTDGDIRVIDTTPTLYGGTVEILVDSMLCGAASSCVRYTPPPGVCNVIDVFDYTALLGGAAMDTATVHVTVTCACGNGAVDAGEECDPGVQNGPSCSSTCKLLASCGDGTLQGAEACDDGNNQSGDGCSWDCRVEGCGNGKIDSGEECDDGNSASGDGCRNN
jgi:cysteine-rich repeat protein